MREPEERDERGQGDETERDSDTREGRFNRIDSRDGGQSAEWTVRGQSDGGDVREEEG